MVDIPLFDGPTFREIVLIVGFIVMISITMGVTLLTLLGCSIWRCCVCCQRRRRRKEVLGDGSDGRGSINGSSSRNYRPVGADLRAQTLLDIEEDERRQKVSRVNRVLFYIVLWTWLFFLGAGPLLWLVIMDYLPWYAGWLSATAFLGLAWFLFFPFRSRDSYKDDEDDRHYAYGHDDGVDASGALRSPHRRRRHSSNELERETLLSEGGYVLVEDLSYVNDTRMRTINPPDGVLRASDDPPRGRSRRTLLATRNPVRLVGGCLGERARRVRRRPFVFGLGLLSWLVLFFTVTFVFEGMCIGEYPISIDFRLVRQLQSSTCSGDAPCHVYLTLPPGNMSSSVVVHFHAANRASGCASTVYYDTESHAGANDTLASYRYNTTGTQFEYSTRDFTRHLHWVRLDDLVPDTVYYFRAGCGSHPQLFSAEKRFLSAPGPDVKNFSFVTGGDMGTSEEAAQIEVAAAQLDPRFAILGGDLAYANALPTCYRVWDKWFDMWEENMITRDGNYIPMVTLVGNHETGGGSSLHQSVSDIPFFFRYFHMYPGDEAVKHEQRQRKLEQRRAAAAPTFHSALAATETEAEVAAEEENPLALPNVYMTDAWDTTYHHHYVGDYLFLTLDSGMFLDVQGAQTEWLRTALESWNATHNVSRPDASGNGTATAGRSGHIMAIYHVPMWPSDMGEDVWQKDMRKYWEPLFDAYHVAVGFENHSHRYGRAVPLKAGKRDEEGTLYLGGGSFGVTPSSNNCSMAWLGYCSTGNPWYMANIQQKRHFLHVQVSPQEIFIEAIDEHGEVFDQATAR